MARNIYKRNGKYYKKIRVGTGPFRGMYLWQPMKKKLFFIPDNKKERFWLDDYEFEKA